MSAESHGISFDAVSLNGVKVSVSSVDFWTAVPTSLPGVYEGWLPEEAHAYHGDDFWRPVRFTNSWRAVWRRINRHRLPKRLRKK